MPTDAGRYEYAAVCPEIARPMQRQDAREIPAVEARTRPATAARRTRGSPAGRRAAARAPAPRTPPPVAARCGCRRPLSPHPRSRRRTGRRSASPRTSVMRLRGPGRADLPDAEREHGAGEVHADHARARPTAPRLPARRRPCPLQTSTSVSRPVRPSDANRARPPPPIDAGAQQAVEQVVARRDRIEHPGDAVG